QDVLMYVSRGADCKLVNGEQLFKIGNGQNLFYICRAVDDFDISFITAGVIAQQQQHSEGRAVQVGCALQIDAKYLGSFGQFFIGGPKLLVRAEIEPALNKNSNLI